MVGPGMYQRKIEHGALVVATGAVEYQPTEHHYGQHDRILTQLELGRLLDVNPLPPRSGSGPSSSSASAPETRKIRPAAASAARAR